MKKSYVKKDTAAHWYGIDGTPHHDADLRIARRNMLFTSPSSVDKDQFVNAGLDAWKRNEIVKAAIENPRQPHESVDDYGDRLFELSNNKAKVAADFGKEVHDAIDQYPQMPLDAKLLPYVDHFGQYFYDTYIESKVASEVVLVDRDLGVAGRCDFVGKTKIVYPVSGELLIPDWKTQNVKKKKDGRKDPQFYDSWKRQLAFYAVAFAKKVGMFPEIPRCASVIIDSNEPCEPFIQFWSEEEIYSAYQDFVVAVNCWCKKRDYWPVGRWTLFHALPNITDPHKDSPFAMGNLTASVMDVSQTTDEDDDESEDNV